MTKYEKISTILGTVALLAAVVSPFITYWVLDPQLQSFKNRARLEVSEVTEPSKPILVPNAGDIVRTKDIVDFLLNAHTYHMQIMNVGNLPAREVSIVLQYGTTPNNPLVEVSPPLLTESADKDNLKFLTLKQPIAPSDSVRIKLRPAPDEIWVSNEYGERNNLVTKAKVSRIVETWYDKDGKILKPPTWAVEVPNKEANKP